MSKIDFRKKETLGETKTETYSNATWSQATVTRVYFNQVPPSQRFRFVLLVVIIAFIVVIIWTVFFLIFNEG